MSQSAGKVVFVLGAGFSYDAGMPLQSGILDRIQDLPVDVMAAPRHTVEVFVPARETLRAFLDATFPRQVTPRLEDLFTVLDQSIAQRLCCGRYDWRTLNEIREALCHAILFVFHAAMEQMGAAAASFYQGVGAHFLLRRVTAGQDGDPFSIVSLNWDTLFEDSIYRCLQNADGIGRADVDYCCYTTPLTDSCPHMPSVLQKAAGLFNVKVVKLHGSTNYVLCPNCGRLYTGIGGTGGVWDQYVLTKSCPVCAGLCADETTAPILAPFFITPTFTKVFDNAHIQMVWHNAYIELSEAEEVVFLGYSLPEADYHLRTLLRRAIQPHARITVVLAGDDEPKPRMDRRLREALAGARYERFFGAEHVTCDYRGVKAYFADEIGNLSLEQQLKSLRVRFGG